MKLTFDLARLRPPQIGLFRGRCVRNTKQRTEANTYGESQNTRMSSDASPFSAAHRPIIFSWQRFSARLDCAVKRKASPNSLCNKGSKNVEKLRIACVLGEISSWKVGQIVCLELKITINGAKIKTKGAKKWMRTYADNIFKKILSFRCFNFFELNFTH